MGPLGPPGPLEEIERATPLGLVLCHSASEDGVPSFQALKMRKILRKGVFTTASYILGPRGEDVRSSEAAGLCFL